MEGLNLKNKNIKVADLLKLNRLDYKSANFIVFTISESNLAIDFKSFLDV